MGDETETTGSWYGDAGVNRYLRRRFEVGKTASAGQEVEAGRTVACLARRSKTGTREYNRVLRVVQISIGVTNGRGVQYTEGEGDGSIKQLNGGTGFKIRR